MEFVKDENAEIEAYLKAKKFDIKEKERIAICKRAEFLSVTRAHHARRLEDEFYRDNIQNTKAGTANAQMRKEQEERISKDIVELNRKEIVEQKYRQHIFDSSSYLRKVQNKLREAYNKQEVAAQIAEVENYRQKEKHKEHYINLQSQKALYSDLEKDYLEKVAALERKEQYRKELQNQMFTKAQEKHREYEDKLRERKETEDIVKRMNDEDVKELQIKKELQRKTQEEIDKYLAAQEIWKQERRKELLEDNYRIDKYAEEQQRKVQGEQEKLAKQQMDRDKWLQSVAKDWVLKHRSRKEHKDILQDYDILRKLENEDEDERKSKEKAMITRLEEQAALEKQCKEKEERDRQYYIEDKRWGEVSKQVDADYNNMMKKKAEDKRKYLIDLREYHKETANFHKQQRVEEFNLITAGQKETYDKEMTRWNYIKNERLRLLKKHVPKIHGFIPRDLITKSDLPILGEEFTKRLSERK